MTKEAFLQHFPEFAAGMTVRSRNGEKLGTALVAREKDLIIEKGFFFPRDYVVTFDQVDHLENGELVLKRASEEMINEVKDEELIPGQALESATPKKPISDEHPSIRDRVA